MTASPDAPDATDSPGSTDSLAAGRDRARITVWPDGPLLLRGDVEIVDASGSPVPGRRRTSALCRCGRSATKPFCDGSHKEAGFTAP